MYSFFFDFVKNIHDTFPTIYPQRQQHNIDDKELEELNKLNSLSPESIFVERFGSYKEMIYLITNGYMYMVNDVYRWNIYQFFDITSYLIEKRKLENRKK